jgi:hypothetical protein
VRNPGRILDEADKAYLGFLSAARESVTEAVDEELSEEQLVAPTHLPAAVDEVASLDLTREKAPVFDVRGRRSSDVASPSGHGSTSSGCTGCTRSSRACSAVSVVTPSTSPTTSHVHAESLVDGATVGAGCRRRRCRAPAELRRAFNTATAVA